jgi:hypothetical protein
MKMGSFAVRAMSAANPGDTQNWAKEFPQGF